MGSSLRAHPSIKDTQGTQATSQSQSNNKIGDRRQAPAPEQAGGVGRKEKRPVAEFRAGSQQGGRSKFFLGRAFLVFGVLVSLIVL